VGTAERCVKDHFSLTAFSDFADYLLVALPTHHVQGMLYLAGALPTMLAEESTHTSSVFPANYEADGAIREIGRAETIKRESLQ